MNDNTKTCVLAAIVLVFVLAVWIVLALWTTAISNSNNDRYAANCAAVMSTPAEARMGTDVNEVC